MRRLSARFLHDSRGATSIEYAILAAILAFAIIASAPLLGAVLNDRLQAAADAVKATP